MSHKRSLTAPTKSAERVALDITIDPDALLFDDIILLTKKEIPPAQLVDILNRAVVGGIGKLPVSAMPAILKALRAQLSQLTSPDPN